MKRKLFGSAGCWIPGAGLLLLAVTAIGTRVSAAESRPGTALPTNSPPSMADARQTAPTLISPEVNPDGRITFRIFAPNAAEVTVNGQAFAVPKPSKDSNGVWTATTSPLVPETYHYQLVIDGLRIADPNCPPDPTSGSPNVGLSVFTVPGASPMFHDVTAVPHGMLHTCLYHSKSLGTVRRLVVYSPPGYDPTSDKQYPALYLLHPARTSEHFWTQYGRANTIADNLIASNAAKPHFIVMLSGDLGGVPRHIRRPPGATSSFTREQLIARDLIEEIIPYVEKSFSVQPGREHRALGGFSMGGAQSFEIGLKHLDWFSHVAGLSAPMNPAVDAAMDKLAEDPASANAKLRLLWLGCGVDDGPIFEGNRRLAELLEKKGVKRGFYQTDGAHSIPVARRSLHALLPRLFNH